jgi:hypothetical protein
MSQGEVPPSPIRASARSSLQSSLLGRLSAVLAGPRTPDVHRVAASFSRGRRRATRERAKNLPSASYRLVTSSKKGGAAPELDSVVVFNQTVWTRAEVQRRVRANTVVTNRPPQTVIGLTTRTAPSASRPNNDKTPSCEATIATPTPL